MVPHCWVASRHLHNWKMSMWNYKKLWDVWSVWFGWFWFWCTHEQRWKGFHQLGGCRKGGGVCIPTVWWGRGRWCRVNTYNLHVCFVSDPETEFGFVQQFFTNQNHCFFLILIVSNQNIRKIFCIFPLIFVREMYKAQEFDLKSQVSEVNGIGQDWKWKNW